MKNTPGEWFAHQPSSCLPRWIRGSALGISTDWMFLRYHARENVVPHRGPRCSARYDGMVAGQQVAARAGSAIVQTILGSILKRWLRTVPEWRHVPDEPQRVRIADAADRLVMNHTAYYLGVCLTVVFGLNVAFRLTGMTQRYLRFLPTGVTSISFFALLIGGYYVTSGVFFRRRLRALVRRRLLELGIPICLHCGYDLRGQTEPRCPECGRGFDPTLLKARPPENAPTQP